MHLTMQFNSRESNVLRLPSANLCLFQAMLYKLLPPERAAFLHDEGYKVDGKPMKLFAMSWPLCETRPRKDKDHIEYSLPIRLVVSTPIVDTLDGLAGGAFGNEDLRIGNTPVTCEGVQAAPLTVTSEEVRVKTTAGHALYFPVPPLNFSFEEWKHMLHLIGGKRFKTLNFSFEEWKHWSGQEIQVSGGALNFSFEEWKPTTRSSPSSAGSAFEFFL